MLETDGKHILDRHHVMMESFVKSFFEFTDIINEIPYVKRDSVCALSILLSHAVRDLIKDELCLK